ncbi:MAG: peptide chain release factor N(5)-glutamine methyltransferase [bacterium]|nr:peptide chain release factor N(5)-glutamine methyltransferase [bacterium]
MRTVAEAWQAGREHLTALGIEEAAVTAEVLLRHALDLNRTQFHIAVNQPVPDGAWARYLGYIGERARGRPLAYIVGHREFMGLDLLVDERVLIPRPETEVLVETVLELLRGTTSPVVADIGTGSGAIAVSVAVLRPDARVVATDLSCEALEVARANATRHGVAERIIFLAGDLLDPVVGGGWRLDAVACNPPYVAAEAAAGLPREIREFEPKLAVVAPGYGESVHARLVDAAPGVLRPGGWLVLEVAAGQAPRVVELLNKRADYEAVQTRRDGLGWERVVAARWATGDCCAGIDGGR